ncbi:MAG: hypothetical protein J0M10_05545 [Chitinophagales bacterium]|nr:hypothetical protein [Chitinophagales bacterium]
MPDLLVLFRNWWKQIVLMVLLALLTSGIIVYLKPPEYLSVATAVPSSTYSSDKARLFNTNIQHLYSALGSPDDLDIIVGTATLDTIYLAVAIKFNLWDHYKIRDTGAMAVKKAAAQLKAGTKVMKSEYGDLKVKVWNTDKQLAPQLANAVLLELQLLHQRLQNAGNESALQGLGFSQVKLMAELAATEEPAARQKLQRQLDECEQLMTQYQLMLENKAPALIVVEQARAADLPDRPKRLQWMLVAGVLALLFSLLVAVVLEKGKSVQVA